MPTQDQLEIIGPGGEIEFHDLDPAKGVANVGRHPDNDIVIDSPGVALFHAMLDHRQKPSQIVILSQEGETTLSGQPLPANVPTELHNWDTLEIAGFTVILVEGTGVAVGPAPAEQPPAPAPPPGAGRPATGLKGLWQKVGKGFPSQLKKPAKLPVKKPAGMPGELAPARGQEAEPSPVPTGTGATAAPLSVTPSRPTARPPDQLDDVLVAELSEREWTVDVEQTATCQLSITNGGDIVATFVIRVEGVDESWVDVSSPAVNLNEGERESVTINITPPRLPSSRAGAHHLAVVVTSPNHPGRSSRRTATLTVNPYHEFAVGELSPKRQTVSWRQRSGQVTIPITNRGNSDTAFRLEAEDDERACRFELQVPGEATGMARQAEMRLPPERTSIIPIQITPISPRLAGLSPRLHCFTVTTTMLEGEQMPRALMGQLRSRPLIGAWQMALFAILLAVATAIIFRPWISDFRIEPKTGVVRAGETVTLSWRTSPFVNRLEVDGLGPIERSARTATCSPEESVVKYALRADTWLSQLLPILYNNKTEPKTVVVIPNTPQIDTFSVDDKDILRGESITLYWSVHDATELVMTANGVAEIIPPEEYLGQRSVSPEKNTIYVLEARNSSGIDLKSMMVRVTSPVLEVQEFAVQPTQITAGESVTITWAVSGTNSVLIAPLPDTYPPSGRITYAPEQTTNFVLSASNAESEIKQVQPVIVRPEPEPPAIEFFAVTPSEVISGSDGVVQLAWSVTGETTGIEISSPAYETCADLLPQDIISREVRKPTVFILTAANGDLSASQLVEVTVVEPTPGAEETPVPEPEIVFFKAEGAEGEEGSVTFQRQDEDDKGRPVFEYQVVEDTTVVLSWETQNADTVAMGPRETRDKDLENQPAEGTKTLFIAEASAYKLVATNDAGKAKAFIELEVIPAPLKIAVIKTATPSSLPEPGGVVTFTVRVDNADDGTITLLSLWDSIHGDLSSQGSCSLPQTVPAGGYVTCSFTATVSGNAGANETDVVTAQAEDDEGHTISGAGSATVNITDVPSSIAVSKTATPSVVAAGGSVTFTVRVTNISAVDSVTVTSLTDTVYGNLDGQGSCSAGQTLSPGDAYECSFGATISGTAGTSETSTATVEGIDDDGNSVSGSGTATVTITTAVQARPYDEIRAPGDTDEGRADAAWPGTPGPDVSGALIGMGVTVTTGAGVTRAGNPRHRRDRPAGLLLHHITRGGWK